MEVLPWPKKSLKDCYIIGGIFGVYSSQILLSLFISLARHGIIMVYPLMAHISFVCSHSAGLTQGLLLTEKHQRKLITPML